MRAGAAVVAVGIGLSVLGEAAAQTAVRGSGGTWPQFHYSPRHLGVNPGEH